MNFMKTMIHSIKHWVNRQMDGLESKINDTLNDTLVDYATKADTENLQTLIGNISVSEQIDTAFEEKDVVVKTLINGKKSINRGARSCSFTRIAPHLYSATFVSPAIVTSPSLSTSSNYLIKIGYDIQYSWAKPIKKNDYYYYFGRDPEDSSEWKAGQYSVKYEYIDSPNFFNAYEEKISVTFYSEEYGNRDQLSLDFTVYFLQNALVKGIDEMLIPNSIARASELEWKVDRAELDKYYLKSDADTVAAQIDTLETKVGDTSVAEQINTALENHEVSWNDLTDKPTEHDALNLLIEMGLSAPIATASNELILDKNGNLFTL